MFVATSLTRDFSVCMSWGSWYSTFTSMLDRSITLNAFPYIVKLQKTFLCDLAKILNPIINIRFQNTILMWARIWSERWRRNILIYRFSKYLDRNLITPVFIAYCWGISLWRCYLQRFNQCSIEQTKMLNKIISDPWCENDSLLKSQPAPDWQVGGWSPPEAWRSSCCLFAQSPFPSSCSTSRASSPIRGASTVMMAASASPLRKAPSPHRCC